MNTDAQTSGMSRRKALGAGLAVAGGVIGAGVGATAVSAATSDQTPVPAGAKPAGSTVAEFQSRIAQRGSSGQAFNSFGFLLGASDAADADLFDGTPPGVATALLTAVATGDLVTRDFNGSVHLLDVVGTLTVLQRDAAGADWDDPASFEAGTRVAEFDLTLQNVLTVFAPGSGLPTLTGDMRQTFAGFLSSGRKFGHVGQNLRFFATGIGTLIDPATLNSNLQIAGNWTLA